MRLEFPSTKLLESSGYNKTLNNPIGEATDDWVLAYLCHVVDYVGTVGYYASAEQGLSGVQGGILAPTLLKDVHSSL